MNSGVFLVLGNDKKMKACRKRLVDRGFSAQNIDLSAELKRIDRSDYIILPLPSVANAKINGTDISFTELLSVIDNGQMVFCGNIDVSSYKNFYSYYSNESFLLKNSRLTAQGVLKIIIDNTEDDIRNINVAVLGYGRCGRAVCRLLSSCGMNITSFSRRYETVTLAEDEGIVAGKIDDFRETILHFDIIVNTIPMNILTKNEISQLNQNNIYIEVASKPYGFDISETDIFNFRYILAESLPGRFTPKSAGYNIADTVLSMIKGDEYG